MEERCLVCGDVIPEGKQVCPNCEAKISPDLLSVYLRYAERIPREKLFEELKQARMEGY